MRGTDDGLRAVGLVGCLMVAVLVVVVTAAIVLTLGGR